MGEVNRLMLKFAVPHGGEPSKIAMPPGSVIRQCGEQQGQIVMWAECPVVGIRWSAEVGPSVEREFAIVATGQTFPDGASYIGTAIINGASLVFHVVEITP